jgi:hypothetical protein
MDDGGEGCYSQRLFSVTTPKISNSRVNKGAGGIPVAIENDL